MNSAEQQLRQEFRAAGRRVLRQPGLQAAHQARLAAALALGMAEPVQGTLADWLYACPDQAAAQREALRQPSVQQGLGALLLNKFAQQLHGGQALPRLSRLATRWSVLAQPSSDAPQRALLCAVDDSQALAQAAVAAILAGVAAGADAADADAAAVHEAAFLAHCLGAQDTLAFMLARRALQRAGCNLGSAWQETMAALEQGGRA